MAHGLMAKSAEPNDLEIFRFYALFFMGQIGKKAASSADYAEVCIAWMVAYRVACRHPKPGTQAYDLHD